MTPTFLQELREWRTILAQYKRSFKDLDPETPLSSILGANKEVAEQIFLCIQWLAGTLPSAEVHEWAYTNYAAQVGRCTPVNIDEGGLVSRDRVVELLHSLDQWETFDMFHRVLQVMALRVANENCAGIVSRADSATQKLELLVFDHMLEDSVDHVRAPVLVWLKRVFLEDWSNSSVLPRNSVEALSLRIHEALGPSIDKALGSGSCRRFPVVPSYLDAARAAKDYLNVEHDKNTVHLFEFNSLFTAQELRTYSRTVHYVRMQKAHTQSQVETQLYQRYQQLLNLSDELGGQAGFKQEHYLLLRISRQNVVKDAFDQMWQRRQGELQRPLRVRLGQTEDFEVGHDLGGVQIEFFNIFWRELLKEEAGTFTTDNSTALTYFRPASLQPLYHFEMAGLFFGLALHNGITLPVNFPLALYQWLLTRCEHDPIISDRWPEIERSQQSLLDEEEIPDLEAVVPFEANGLRLSVLARLHPSAEFRDPAGRVPVHVTEATRIVHQRDLGTTANAISYNIAVARPHHAVDVSKIETEWPGWRLEEFTEDAPQIASENKHDYVKFFKRWLAWGSVASQLHAFTKGFHTIIPRHTIAFLTIEQLRTIAEGMSSFSIESLQRCTEYENYDPNSRYIRSFWRLVTSWPEEKQRQLIKFVTAIERMPANGASDFKWKIERPSPDEPWKLPTSSTCFRTLYLPKYPSAEVLERKLSVAFEYGLEGFGTG